MYIKAIEWYLENTNYKIVFCENSGTDISQTFPSNSRIEFITYTSENIPDKTKGYKKMEILEYIYQNSKFISKIDESSILEKITGRLIALNIKKIITKITILRDKNKPFVSAYLNGRKPWSDSRFIFFSISYFPILISYKEKINNKHYFEHIVTDSIRYLRKSDIKFIYPPYPLRIDGISGGFGHSYNISDQKFLRLNIKHQIRRILFKIGILPTNK